MKTVSIKHTYWDIAADIYFPDDFNSEKKYPAIISAHPIGSCKEQTSGSVYGAALAKAGFIVIAFDASFQGSSGGEPRYLEDPTMRVKDFSIVVDYLTTLPPYLTLMPGVLVYWVFVVEVDMPLMPQ